MQLEQAQVLPLVQQEAFASAGRAGGEQASALGRCKCGLGPYEERNSHGKDVFFLYCKSEVCSIPHVLTHRQASISLRSLASYILWMKLWLHCSQWQSSAKLRGRGLTHEIQVPCLLILLPMIRARAALAMPFALSSALLCPSSPPSARRRKQRSILLHFVGPFCLHETSVLEEQPRQESV